MCKRDWLYIFISHILFFVSIAPAYGSDCVPLSGKTPVHNFSRNKSYQMHEKCKIPNEKNKYPTLHKSDESSLDQKRLSTLVYRLIDNPETVKKIALNALVMNSLNQIGVGDEVEAFLALLKKNTHFIFEEGYELQFQLKKAKFNYHFFEDSSITITSGYADENVLINYSWSF